TALQFGHAKAFGKTVEIPYPTAIEGDAPDDRKAAAVPHHGRSAKQAPAPADDEVPWNSRDASALRQNQDTLVNDGVARVGVGRTRAAAKLQCARADFGERPRATDGAAKNGELIVHPHGGRACHDDVHAYARRGHEIERAEGTAMTRAA